MFPRSWGNLPGDLHALFLNNFEAGMGSLWDRGSHAIPNLMQQMAIFFARYSLMPSRSDSYSWFLDHLAIAEKLDDVIFSSLNYECLLEIAASRSGRSVNYLSEHTPSAQSVTVWKLHGSCNFLPGENITATRGVSFSPGVSMNPGVRVVNPSQVAPYCTGNTALYPIMSVYARGKPVQISPYVTDTLEAWWKTAVETADVVAVIGVHPHPVDEHIWLPLATTDATVLLVGNEPATSAWIDDIRQGKHSAYIGPRFHDHLQELAELL